VSLYFSMRACVRLCRGVEESVWVCVYVHASTYVCGRERRCRMHTTRERERLYNDDDCFYYHSWRNNVVIAFGTLSSLGLFSRIWSL